MGGGGERKKERKKNEVESAEKTEVIKIVFMALQAAYAGCNHFNALEEPLTEMSGSYSHLVGGGGGGGRGGGGGG